MLETKFLKAQARNPKPNEVRSQKILSLFQLYLKQLVKYLFFLASGHAKVIVNFVVVDHFGVFEKV